MKIRRKKKNKKSSFGLFGLIIISIGIIIISYDFILSKKEKAFNTMNIRLFDSETPVEVNDNNKPDDTEVNNQVVDNQPKQNMKVNYNYIAILEIPKIKLKQGFLDINSKYNNVDYNITVIQTSTMPDVENGNLILASHSGNSYISYFRNLYKLEIGDQASIYYNNIKYTYNIVNIYNVEKNGQVAIYRNSNKTCLTLITCTKNSETEQTVYILELVDKQEY